MGGGGAFGFVRNVATGLNRALNIPTWRAMISMAVSSLSKLGGFSDAWPSPMRFLPFPIGIWVFGCGIVLTVLVDG